MLVGALALGLVSCRTSKHTSGDDAHAAHGSSARLELNNGKKWVVVKPMMVHVRNLEQAVADFDQTAARDHSALVATIQEHLGRLVTNCTMEGKAHDELHKWLIPFLAVTADYAKATDLGVQQQKLQEIKQALTTFNTYFE